MPPDPLTDAAQVAREREAEAIVRDLAALPCTWYDDPQAGTDMAGDGEYTCGVCDGSGIYEYRGEHHGHKPGCPWRRAVEWVNASPPAT